MGSGREHWERVAALEAMGCDPSRVPELVEVLGGERECCHTLGAAIRSLVALCAVDAGPAILKRLARERDPEVREIAVAALGELRCLQARRLLERLAASDPDDAMRALARAALARL